MSAATIKLFLVYGDPRRLRTGEISNWTGKAIAAPRTGFDKYLARVELRKPGVYVLIGANPETGRPMVYIGEAEVLRHRLRQHQDKEFWVQAVAFTSKDENLTKAHIRYLEGRLISETQEAGRVEVHNAQASGAKLPESDREDMEVYLDKMRQLLPVMGSEILTPVAGGVDKKKAADVLTCEIKGHKAQGRRTETGFAVFKDSEAVLKPRPSARKRHPFVLRLRSALLDDGTLVKKGDRYVFARDAEFSSPSAAAAVVHGGGANGLLAWKDRRGRPLKDLETSG